MSDTTEVQIDTPWLTRDAAVLWFHAKGLTHITYQALSRLATYGKGPDYHKQGKQCFYTQDSLDAWLKESMKPVTRGRGSVRGA